jgi:hypothetical protein
VLLPPRQRERCRAAGPFTPRIARPVTRTGMWRRYVLDTDNWHDWTLTSWIAALSAAPYSFDVELFHLLLHAGLFTTGG